MNAAGEDGGGRYINESNPQFANKGLRLPAGSPCKDTSNNEVIPTTEPIDLDTNPQIHNGIVDMGAYAYRVN
jgi:hypothetical protein